MPASRPTPHWRCAPSSSTCSGHSHLDTPDRVDFAFLESVTRAATAVVLDWAELEDAGR